MAPEGSYWYNLVKNMERALSRDHQIRVILYWGNSMGDEADIVRKIRIGQLQAAGLTSHGLEMIAPEIRAYDIPFVFESYEEFFSVRDTLFPELQKRFEERGYKLLSHFAIGFIYIFSRKENPWNSNLWVWAGDALSEARGKEMRELFKIVPLQLSDVLQALTTGMIDSVSNGWYTLQALQLANHIRSYIDMPQFLYTAGMIMRKDVWDNFSDNLRKEMQQLALKYSLEAEREVVKLNLNAQQNFGSRIKRVSGPDENMQKLKAALHRVKRRILDENPRVKEFHTLIEGELAKIRKQN
ncbi:MAG: TRAP transporter substrate-binding protein DctP [Candidatus Calescibacterium sp.]|nr:TRAP transporter substrate-binding protein DctP [Candidatus Calescibacterium sp.]MCX7734434.1 TRAP transporter substrate-binding protein DctP [bacterium]MDW8086800.1 TRAP transporter substrate-binding protein DctP [Candidatus Calescibacterium sp.]